MQRSLRNFFSSTVGRKLLMGVSGLGLVGFAITHLLGNLALLRPGSDAFNLYAFTLHQFGFLVYVAEVGLLFVFVLHIVTGIRVAINNRKARNVRYQAGVRSKGGPSKSSFASRNMAITGLILLVFLVVHVWQFRFGPGVESGYIVPIEGQDARDLHRLVLEVFDQPFWVAFYVGAMALFGFHLRHGFWSAFQSLGVMYPSYSRQLHFLALVIAIMLAVGFLLIPVWLYFDIGGMLSGIYLGDLSS